MSEEQDRAIEAVDQHEVSWKLIADWQLDAAGWGVLWTLRAARKLGLHQRSAIVEASAKWTVGPVGLKALACGLEFVRWFSGPPSDVIGGCAESSGEARHVWVSAQLNSREELVQVGAHEAAHVLGYSDEREAEIFGEAARKAFGGTPVYLFFGRVDPHYVPPEAKEGSVEGDALLLERADGQVSLLWNRCTGSVPLWAYQR